MSFLLLRPYFLSYKNRLRERPTHGRFINRDVAILFTSAIFMFSIFWGTQGFLLELQKHAAFAPQLPAKLLQLSFLGFLMLLLFTNGIASLGALFSANDLPLLIALPVTKMQLYLARLVETMLTASWMFFMFVIPLALGYQTAMHLPWYFTFRVLLIMIPFAFIPAAISSTAVTLIMNIVPAYRLREILIVCAIAMAGALLILGPTLPIFMPLDKSGLQSMAHSLVDLHDPSPFWVPSVWASELALEPILGVSPFHREAGLLLISSAIGLCALGYLIFDFLYFRGWTFASETTKSMKLHQTTLGVKLGRALIPIHPPYRAICYKEARMFLRDPAQCLQLVLLLMLAFIYLYNFRALKMVSPKSAEGEAWWLAILAITNITLGSSACAAIATRFVFPSVSLEGRAYQLLRTTPLSIDSFLRFKALSWFGPMWMLCATLLLSGALAVDVTPATLLVCAILSLFITMGIVGLAIGIGAIYARFDWESPMQLAGSFGSLVFMLMAVGLIFINVIPATFLIIVSAVPNFANTISKTELHVAQFCAYALSFWINLFAARAALHAGAERLAEMEN